MVISNLNHFQAFLFQTLDFIGFLNLFWFKSHCTFHLYPLINKKNRKEYLYFLFSDKRLILNTK